MHSTVNIRERAAQAASQYRHCLLCEHRCEADRTQGERGPCKAGVVPRVFRHRVEYGEELELIPSHLFYLSGCDLRCAFCIAESNAFDPSQGTPLTSPWLAEAVAWGRARGARNLQFVGGEPTIHLPGILSTLAELENPPPIVWKSDFYGTEAAFELLDGIVDVFVADFKFGNDACAQRIAGISSYLAPITRNLLSVSERNDLIIRHLLLPGHFDCCFRPVVEWMQRHLPRAKFSIRDGYLPKWRSKHFDELARPLPRNLGKQARQLAFVSGLCVID